ncbi:Hypothetical protein A7982_08077 [Minicystis rosea]|nr:Hypothetical protein A7982_08077 [Minicystis rosea]
MLRMRVLWMLVAFLVASPAFAAGFDAEQLAAELAQRDRVDALARARRLADDEAWDELRAQLTQAIPALDRHAALDDRLEARALLGRAFGNLGRHEEAAARHRFALALARGATLDERGRDAVGEALFRLAEPERAKAERITLAPYTGQGDRASVLAYLTGPATRWLIRRRAAVEATERAYLRLFGFELPPPVDTSGSMGVDPNAWTVDLADLERIAPHSPRWAIAAAARIALGWGAFVEAMRALPVPPPLRGLVPGRNDGLTYEELRGWYITPIDEPDESLKRRAKQACVAALRLALQHRITDEHTRACEVWLSRNYGAEWHVIDELRPKIAPPFAAGPFAPARP